MMQSLCRTWGVNKEEVSWSGVAIWWIWSVRHSQERGNSALKTASQKVLEGLWGGDKNSEGDW